jgi:hypothetical protein
MVWFEPHTIVNSAPVQLARGRMVDDYFAVEDLGDGTYAIGEPHYYVVAQLTRLPVTVIVSHLHFDHLGGIATFKDVAMIDLPETRADVSGGFFKPGRYEYMGFLDGRSAPSFQWPNGSRRARPLISEDGHSKYCHPRVIRRVLWRYSTRRINGYSSEILYIPPLCMPFYQVQVCRLTKRLRGCCSGCCRPMPFCGRRTAAARFRFRAYSHQIGTVRGGGLLSADIRRE